MYMPSFLSDAFWEFLFQLMKISFGPLARSPDLTVCDFFNGDFWINGHSLHQQFLYQSGVEGDLNGSSIQIDLFEQTVQNLMTKLQENVAQEGRHSMDINFQN